ncbi:MAG: hypothetical protein ACFCU8_19510 [Thermosynechococcaceae cyanobacterium]
MSAGSRIIIAAIAFVCSAGFFLTAIDPSGLSTDASIFFGLSVFCGLVAIASLSSRSHPVTVRMIGTMLCCGYISQLPHLLSEQHPFQMGLGLLLWGAPASYLAVTGEFFGKK